MPLEVGDFCSFIPAGTTVPRPPDCRQIGKIIAKSSPFSLDGITQCIYRIQDANGNVREVTSHGPMGASLTESYTNDLYPETVKTVLRFKGFETFTKPESFFREKLPAKIEFRTTMLTPETVSLARAALKPIKRGLEYEDMWVSDLMRMVKLLGNVMYSYPITLKSDSAWWGDADSKQGAYYATKDSFDDIVFNYSLSSASRKNRKRGLPEECSSSPRIKLSLDRVEELRIATLILYHTISREICAGLCGDEEAIDERTYLGWIEETKTITERAIYGG